jgi:hypothetical protein
VQAQVGGRRGVRRRARRRRGRGNGVLGASEAQATVWEEGAGGPASRGRPALMQPRAVPPGRFPYPYPYPYPPLPPKGVHARVC